MLFPHKNLAVLWISPSRACQSSWLTKLLMHFSWVKYLHFHTIILDKEFPKGIILTIRRNLDFFLIVRNALGALLLLEMFWGIFSPLGGIFTPMNSTICLLCLIPVLTLIILYWLRWKCSDFVNNGGKIKHTLILASI